MLMTLILGCSPKVNLTFKESLMANDVKLTNSEKNKIIEYLSNYEFQYLKRDEMLYGGAVYVIEYEKDGIKYYWDISGSGNESSIQTKDNEIYYFTYDPKLIDYLSKFVH